MPARQKVDTSKMTPEEKAAYQARRANASKPKPAFLVYDNDPADPSKIVVNTVTRSADTVMEAFATNRDLKFVRFELK